MLSRPFHPSHFVVVLVRFFPLRCAEVRPLEVMVGLRVLLTVLLECGRVSSRGVLSKCERLCSAAHFVVTDLARGFECIICREVLLEIHPVLSRVAKLLLLTVKRRMVIWSSRWLYRWTWSTRFERLSNPGHNLPCCSSHCFRRHVKSAHTFKRLKKAQNEKEMVRWGYFDKENSERWLVCLPGLTYMGSGGRCSTWRRSANRIRQWNDSRASYRSGFWGWTNFYALFFLDREKYYL